MNKVVLDASAVLAVLYQENGAAEIHELISNENTLPLISSVNLCEVQTRMLRDGLAEDFSSDLLAGLKLTVHEFGEEDARQAAVLYRQVSNAGLSLGDRACLALARSQKAVAWTADRAWSRVKTDVKIELIRV